MPSAQDWHAHANQIRSLAARSEQHGDPALALYLLAQAARMEELASRSADPVRPAGELLARRRVRPDGASPTPESALRDIGG